MKVLLIHADLLPPFAHAIPEGRHGHAGGDAAGNHRRLWPRRRRAADLTEDTLRAALRKTLTGYKVPRQINFADSLPREDSGKIFKRKLREPYWAGRARAI